MRINKNSIVAALSCLLTFAGCSSDDDPPVVNHAAPSSEMAADAGIVTGPAGAIRVDDGGQGSSQSLAPVVFVHSYAGDAFHWKFQLDHLRPSRRALALELRGHGLSEPPAGDAYGVENFADDIAAVVDAFSLERFYLVGHSLGGSAALSYAGRNPHRVAGLLLVAAPGKMPAAEAERIIRSLESERHDQVMRDYWAQLTRDARPETLAIIQVGRDKMPKERSLSIIKGMFRYDPVPALTAYQGLRLAVTTPRENVPYALHRLVRNLPSRAITGTSHWMHLDKPEEFNQILDSFLATETSPSPSN
jgi:pimeloyl-ACP methyl ester carboxylesterase